MLIGLLQYRLWFGDGNIREFRRLHERIEELEQDGSKRRERNAALEAEVMDLKQGLDAIEERARQDLGMIKEGEVFIQVIDHRHPEATNQPVEPLAEPEKNPDEKVAPKRRSRRAQLPQAAQTPPAADPSDQAVER